MNNVKRAKTVAANTRKKATAARVTAASKSNPAEKQKLLKYAAILNKTANTINAKANNGKKRVANIAEKRTALLGQMRARELEKKRAALARQTMAELKAVIGTAVRRNGTATGTVRRNGTAMGTVRKNATASGTVRRNAKR